MMISELQNNNGVATYDINKLIPLVQHSNHSTLPSGNTWSCQQNSNNNAYYVTIPTGSVNNNNKNNTYAVVPVAELNDEVNLLLIAEEDCYKNKSYNIKAAAYHFHLSQLYVLAYYVKNDLYSPKPSICFVLLYPKIREVFAAIYEDRVVHHLVAPFIMSVTETVHTINGNVSHGNRPKLSAQTAAKQLQMWMQEMPNGMVMTMDIQGFFMNISRQMSYDIFVKFCRKYVPNGYSDDEIEQILDLIYKLILNDPSENCLLHSSKSLLDRVPKHRSIRNKCGRGLPIGNFYSQLIANLISSIWGTILRYIPGIRLVQFVDDMSVVVRDKCLVNAVHIASYWILAGLELKLHPNKFYCQPVSHGVYFCGRYVFKDRIYISNRCYRACKGKIYHAINSKLTYESITNLVSSINSYTGIMCHCSSYNLQKQLMKMILESKFGKYVYFIKKKNHLVCRIYPQYTTKHLSEKTMNNIYKNYKEFKYEYKQSKCKSKCSTI